MQKEKSSTISTQQGRQVLQYHSDNGVFKSKEFQADLKVKGQTINFSCVGAHHQNGVSERVIHTVVEWARTLIIHQAMHWPKEAQLDLWLFAMSYSVWLWNHLLNQETGLSPNEICYQTLEQNFNHLKQTHVWGCPMYVLKPTIQDDRKLPKWQPKSRQGAFLGFLDSHLTIIGLIKNLHTVSVSPQYHVVYNDLFTTVTNSGEDGIPVQQQSKHWENLIQKIRKILERPRH